MITFEIKHKVGDLSNLTTKEVITDGREILCNILDNHTDNGLSHFCLKDSPYCIRVTGTKETSVIKQLVNFHTLQTELYCYVNRTLSFFRKANYNVPPTERLCKDIVERGSCSISYIATDGMIKECSLNNEANKLELTYQFGNVYVPFNLRSVLSNEDGYHDVLDILKSYAEYGLEYDDVVLMEDTEIFCERANKGKDPRDIVFCLRPTENNFPLFVQLAGTKGNKCSGEQISSLALSIK